MTAGKTVLVVDDNPTVTRFVESILRPMGFQVLTAANGVEALSRVVKTKVDLILLDLVMPRMDGYHFCKILDQKGLAKDAKIILLSAAKEDITKRVRELTRIDEALPKPVRAQQLRAIVEKLLPRETEPAPVPSAAPAEAGEGGVAAEDERTSDDDIGGRVDLVGLVRDKIDHAVAEGLASRVDEIAAAKNREEVLALVAQVLAAAINDPLVEQIIDVIRAPKNETF